MSNFILFMILSSFIETVGGGRRQAPGPSRLPLFVHRLCRAPEAAGQHVCGEKGAASGPRLRGSGLFRTAVGKFSQGFFRPSSVFSLHRLINLGST
jgi:hypothetical protein